MAKKAASKAEKTVQDNKKKASAASSSSKSSGKKAAAKKPPAVKKNPKVSTEYENPITSSITGGILSLFLFILFVLILFKILQSLENRYLYPAFTHSKRKFLLNHKDIIS